MTSALTQDIVRGAGGLCGLDENHFLSAAAREAVRERERFLLRREARHVVPPLVQDLLDSILVACEAPHGSLPQPVALGSTAVDVVAQEGRKTAVGASGGLAAEEFLRLRYPERFEDPDNPRPRPQQETVAAPSAETPMPRPQAVAAPSAETVKSQDTETKCMVASAVLHNAVDNNSCVVADRLSTDFESFRSQAMKSKSRPAQCAKIVNGHGPVLVLTAEAQHSSSCLNFEQDAVPSSSLTPTTPQVWYLLYLCLLHTYGLRQSWCNSALVAV